jgi:hypothetical protein
VRAAAMAYGHLIPLACISAKMGASATWISHRLATPPTSLISRAQFERPLTIRLEEIERGQAAQSIHRLFNGLKTTGSPVGLQSRESAMLGTAGTAQSRLAGRDAAPPAFLARKDSRMRLGVSIHCRPAVSLPCYGDAVRSVPTFRKRSSMTWDHKLTRRRVNPVPDRPETEGAASRPERPSSGAQPTV